MSSLPFSALFLEIQNLLCHSVCIYGEDERERQEKHEATMEKNKCILFCMTLNLSRLWLSDALCTTADFESHSPYFGRQTFKTNSKTTHIKPIHLYILSTQKANQTQSSSLFLCVYQSHDDMKLLDSISKYGWMIIYHKT